MERLNGIIDEDVFKNAITKDISSQLKILREYQMNIPKGDLLTRIQNVMFDLMCEERYVDR